MNLQHVVGSQTVLASAARTTDGQSSGHNFGGFIEGRFLVNVSATSGTDTPTLTLTPQFSVDNSTFYDTDESATEITATGQYSIPVTNFGKYVRLDYGIVGTNPSFTFSVQWVGKT